MAFRAAAMIESRCFIEIVPPVTPPYPYLPPSVEEQLEVNTPRSILLMWEFFMWRRLMSFGAAAMVVSIAAVGWWRWWL